MKASDPTCKTARHMLSCTYLVGLEGPPSSLLVRRRDQLDEVLMLTHRLLRGKGLDRTIQGVLLARVGRSKGQRPNGMAQVQLPIAEDAHIVKVVTFPSNTVAWRLLEEKGVSRDESNQSPEKTRSEAAEEKAHHCTRPDNRRRGAENTRRETKS